MYLLRYICEVENTKTMNKYVMKSLCMINIFGHFFTLFYLYQEMKILGPHLHIQDHTKYSQILSLFYYLIFKTTS